MNVKKFKMFVIDSLVEDDTVALIEERNEKGGSMVVVLDSGERFSVIVKKLAHKKH
jgi:hypothetical protein